jgi:phosphoribosylglycinamide formyltransferase-1
MTKRNTKEKLRIGILISGTGSNMSEIIDACSVDFIDGEVAFVGSDVPGVRGLAIAAEKNIPTFVVNYKSIGAEGMVHINDITGQGYDAVHIGDLMQKSQGIVPKSISDDNQRIAWLMKRFMAENMLLHEMSKYDFDLLVLAGFMRNLSAFFIDRINVDPEKPRIMNIHPALLPSFPGTNGYEDTFNYGCKVYGCTVHFVDYGEDTGPIIGQTALDVRPADTLDWIKRNGLRAEWLLYPQCIQLFAQDRLRVITGHNGRKIVKIAAEDNCEE